MVNRIVVGAHYGLKDWLIQRVTAVVMAVWLVVMLGLLLVQRPAALGDVLWLLLIEEHMLRYRELVHRQVRAQLASPLLQERALVPLPLPRDGVEPVAATP